MCDEVRFVVRSGGEFVDFLQRGGRESLDPGAAAHALADVIDQCLMPAIVANRYQAANPIARALSPEFTPGQNLLRWRC